MSTDLTEYYERRAPEYDLVYAKPERQGSLAQLRELIVAQLAGREVLEIAAGTGYWTPAIAARARGVLATDYNPSPLAIARGRDYPLGNVRFAQADAYDLSTVEGEFDGFFAGFWWSHMSLEVVDRFLEGLAARLGPGARAVFVDNVYVEGSSYPLTSTDAIGNTYQARKLADGSDYEVMKNFPTEAQLRAAAGRHGSDVEAVMLDYHWLLAFTV